MPTRTQREAQTRTRTRLSPSIVEFPKASSILMSWQAVVVALAVTVVLSFLRDRLGTEKSRHSSAALGTRHKRRQSRRPLKRNTLSNRIATNGRPEQSGRGEPAC
ncbi:hypothetical protein BD309DRAFT_961343 [Dichomitus squalens]|nr:hypothetical protein BD309DRAFT_961343 [Dichomitus squalens]